MTRLVGDSDRQPPRLPGFVAARLVGEGGEGRAAADPRQEAGGAGAAEVAGPVRMSVAQQGDRLAAAAVAG